MPPVLLFPGQSSADPQMVHRALALHNAAHEILARARSIIGADAVQPYTTSSEARLRSNLDIQISVFLTTQMHLAALRAEGIESRHSAGLSLGEYSHLVHIGALTFDAALALVAARGAAYDTSPPGIMVAVLGADRPQVEDAVNAARKHGAVFVSNYNAPTQHVIAGDRAAVERVAHRLEDEYGAYTVETESHVPMHSPLLEEVACRFRPHLEQAPWQRPHGPYTANVTGRVHPDPSPGDFIEQMTAHVTQPVRWRDAIETIAAQHPDATFVEVGPGAILHNMLARTWLPVRRARTDAPTGDPAGHLRATVEALRG
jgi:[acyl-carrier-protein] S-malonyltransferase